MYVCLSGVGFSSSEVSAVFTISSPYLYLKSLDEETDSLGPHGSNTHLAAMTYDGILAFLVLSIV